MPILCLVPTLANLPSKHILNPIITSYLCHLYTHRHYQNTRIPIFKDTCDQRTWPDWPSNNRVIESSFHTKSGCQSLYPLHFKINYLIPFIAMRSVPMSFQTNGILHPPFEGSWADSSRRSIEDWFDRSISWNYDALMQQYCCSNAVQWSKIIRMRSVKGMSQDLYI